MKTIRGTLAETFPAMKEKNFRLFFYGQLVSFAGTWLQSATQGWKIEEMTGSAREVGTVTAMQMLPAFLLTFFGGTIVDRFDKRKALYVTQVAAMIQAFILGYLTLKNLITVGEIKTLAFSLGIINAIELPARHSLMMETVTTDAHQRSAAAMNASFIMLGQIGGGILTSILVPLVGVSGSFFLNGLSFIAVIVTMMKMDFGGKIGGNSSPEKHEHPLRAMVSGWKFIRSQRFMLFQMILSGMIAVLGFSYRAIFPTISHDVFHAGAAVLGFLQTAVAVGALVASIAVSKYSAELGRHGTLFKKFIIGGVLLTGTALVLFSRTASLPLALACLTMSGAGLIMGISTLRGTILAPLRDNKVMRGRVLGFTMTVMTGCMSLGSLLAGMLGERFGSARALLIIGCASILLAVMLFIRRNHIAEKPSEEIPVGVPGVKVTA